MLAVKQGIHVHESDYTPFNWKRKEREGLRAGTVFCFWTSLFPCCDTAKSALPDVGFLSLAHEDTWEAICFSCLWNAPDCTKQDVQLYCKNIKPSWAEPPPVPTHMNTYYSHYCINQQRMKNTVLWMLTSTGTRLKLHMLLSLIFLQLLSLSHHKVSHSFPLQWRQSESLQASLLWIPANCKYWSNGSVTALETIYAYLQEK